MTDVAMGEGGEFDTIRAIAAALGDVATGWGDDTAPIPDGEGTLVTSTDSATEGVHFRADWLRPEEIGWRAAAAALSDLAAAAAAPAGVVVALTLPGDASDALAVGVMRGIGSMARAVGTRILGGNLTRGPSLAITTTVFGHAARVMSRRGASPGDGVYVTGQLGGARAALLAWLDGRTPAIAARIAFAHPQPRLGAGQWLAAQGATAMLDISDGLGGDSAHLAAASGVALRIDLERLPVQSAVYAEAARAGVSAVAFAAAGGEDYELLVTLPASFARATELEPASGVVLTRIGEVREGQGVTFTDLGSAVEIPAYRHR